MRDLTCPFCGGPASVVMAGADLPRRWVSCADRRGCGAGGPYSDSAEEAIEAFCGVARDAKLGAMVRSALYQVNTHSRPLPAWVEDVARGHENNGREHHARLYRAIADAFREEEGVSRG